MRFAALPALTATLLCWAFVSAGHAETPAAEVVVDLRPAHELYYEGDPLTVQITVRNPGPETLRNPIRTPLWKGLTVRAGDGRTLKSKGKPAQRESARPKELAPGSSYGATVELAPLYPELGRAGRYEMQWSGDGIASEAREVTVIPRYDPAKRYTARIDTEYGRIVLSLAQEESPIAVKSFVDLANAGFYEGLPFSEVHADSFIVGGDPRTSPHRRPFLYPAEQSSVPLVAGTVVMKPAGPAPPSNGPVFMIVLKPQPAWTGQVTVLGRVIRGLSVVQQISRQPSSMLNSKPHFQPLKEIQIGNISIVETEPSPETPSS